MLAQPLHPMEVERLKCIMRNNARLQQLGIRSLTSLFASLTVFSPKKSKNEGSGSDYDLEGEANINDLSDEDISDESFVNKDNELVNRCPYHKKLVSILKKPVSERKKPVSILKKPVSNLKKLVSVTWA